MTFGREKAEVAQIAPVNEAAVQSDYLGVWTITGVTTEGLTLPAEAADMSGDTITIYGETLDMTLMGTELTALPCTMDGYRMSFLLIDTDVVLTLHTDGSVAGSPPTRRILRSSAPNAATPLMIRISPDAPRPLHKHANPRFCPGMPALNPLRPALIPAVA